MRGTHPITPLAEPWLALKLSLLTAYVVIDVMALRRARSPSGRVAWLVAALARFVAMYSIARAHHPLGLLRPLLD